MKWKQMEPWMLSMADGTLSNRRCRSFWIRRMNLMNQSSTSHRTTAVVPLVLIAFALLPSVHITTREVLADDVQLPTETVTAVPPSIAVELPIPIDTDAKTKAIRQRDDLIVVTAGKLKTVNSLRQILQYGDEIPDAIDVQQVENGRYTILAKQTGTYTIGSSNEQVTIVAVVDSTAVQDKLNREGFANVNVTPSVDGVVLSGSVDDISARDRCVRIAKNHCASVVNQIGIGTEQISVDCRIVELTCEDNDALESLGANRWVPCDLSNGGGFILLLDGDADQKQFERKLKSIGKTRTLATPRVITHSGRPATIHIGKEIPIMIPGTKTVSVEYKTLGHRITFVPTSRDDGKIRLECRPAFTEVDGPKSIEIDGKSIPSLRTKSISTAANLGDGGYLVAAMKLSEPSEKTNRFVLTISKVEKVDGKIARMRRQTKRQ